MIKGYVVIKTKTVKRFLKHRRHIGSIEISTKDNCLYGKIIGINDLVSYEAKSVDELKISFIESLENYLETCKELGKEPEKAKKNPQLKVEG